MLASQRYPGKRAARSRSLEPAERGGGRPGGEEGTQGVRGAPSARQEEVALNEEHLRVLASPRWAELLRQQVRPWLESVGALGDDVLEVGPGPGLTTDLLLTLAPRVTAVEADAGLAADLGRRLAGRGVEVINGRAEQLDFAPDRFSAAACFAVLHHAGTAAVQDRVFTELLRVLRPGGVLVGSEGYDTERTRAAHAGDQFAPVDPEELPGRLRAIGFTGAVVTRGELDFRFQARKPGRRTP
jgi:SAM-dependent methyltransferase